MRIDAHQHFWRYNEAAYPWITKGTALEHDWLPEHLQHEAGKVGVTGSVAVQARPSIEESRWLLELADQNPFIKGVVGWVDLQSEALDEELAALKRHPKFVGVRHVVQSEPDAAFMLKPEFLRGLGTLRRFNLAYDFLIFPKQLPAALQVAQQFPEQRFVVDHIAKPVIRAGLLRMWREDMRDLAKCPNVFVKISGLVTEAHHAAWKPEDFRPYLDLVWEYFGEERVMFGSDWPVCLLAASYEQTFTLAADYVSQSPAETQAKFFGGNAARFYGLQP